MQDYTHKQMVLDSEKPMLLEDATVADNVFCLTHYRKLRRQYRVELPAKRKILRIYEEVI